jgi:hypothetical protein
MALNSTLLERVGLHFFLSVLRLLAVGDLAFSDFKSTDLAGLDEGESACPDLDLFFKT